MPHADRDLGRAWDKHPAPGERGGEVVRLVRYPALVADVRQADADIVICDLEEASADYLRGTALRSSRAGLRGRRGPEQRRLPQGFRRQAAGVLMADAAEHAPYEGSSSPSVFEGGMSKGRGG